MRAASSAGISSLVLMNFQAYYSDTFRADLARVLASAPVTAPGLTQGRTLHPRWTHRKGRERDERHHRSAAPLRRRSSATSGVGVIA